VEIKLREIAQTYVNRLSEFWSDDEFLDWVASSLLEAIDKGMSGHEAAKVWQQVKEGMAALTEEGGILRYRTFPKEAS